MNKFTFKENFIFWFFNFLNIVININKKINQKIMKQISKCEQERIHENIYLSYKGKIVSNAILFLSKNYIGREILEIGGGDGSFYIKFKIKYKNLKNLISIDLVPKSKFVKKGDCTSLRFRDEQFDTIFSLDVIEHLNDNI